MTFYNLILIFFVLYPRYIIISYYVPILYSFKPRNSLKRIQNMNQKLILNHPRVSKKSKKKSLAKSVEVN